MNRRQFILKSLLSGVGVAMLTRPALATPGKMQVFKSPACGCCSAWVGHIARAGFNAVTRDVDEETLWSMKTRAGITPELGSCHTAFIDGYVIEGHVPGADIHRLLAGRPDALGLTVPGMPIGSPGMETGHQKDRFDTLLVLKNGSVQIFASYGI